MTNRYPLVQNNSVQLQFASVTRDRDALRNAMDADERERCLVEKQLQGLHGSQRTLTEQVRVAQGSLGRVNGQRAMWREERDRLNRQMEEERQALEQSAQEVEQCQTEETKRRRMYCQEMKQLSDNLEHLLRQYEGARLKSLVGSSEMVERLYGIWQDKRNHIMTEDTEEMDSKLVSAMNLFQEANGKWNQEQATHDRLQQQVLELRAQVLASGNFEINEEKLVALEETWKEEPWNQSGNQDNNAYGNSTTGAGGNMELFYGSDNASASFASDNNTGDEEDGGDHGMHSGMLQGAGGENGGGHEGYHFE